MELLLWKTLKFLAYTGHIIRSQYFFSIHWRLFLPPFRPYGINGTLRGGAPKDLSKTRALNLSLLLRYVRDGSFVEIFGI